MTYDRDESRLLVRARARRMIKSVEWTGEKIIKFILPETEDRWSEREEGTWRLPVIFIQRLECRQNPRPLLPLPFVSLSVSLLYPLSVIRRLVPTAYLFLSLHLFIHLSVPFARTKGARHPWKVDIQPWLLRGSEYLYSFICQPLRAHLPKLKVPAGNG